MIAAIEQFLRDTAVAPEPEQDAVSGWVRAARLESIDRDPGRWGF